MQVGMFNHKPRKLSKKRVTKLATWKKHVELGKTTLDFEQWLLPKSMRTA